MRKWQQRVSIGYLRSGGGFTFRFAELFRFSARRTITYSQFKALARKGLMTKDARDVMQSPSDDGPIGKPAYRTPGRGSCLKK